MSGLADIVLEIRKFLTGLAGTITWDILFYLAVGFELLMIVFFIIKSSFSYEMRMERILYKLNRWLNTNQFIDQNNLIEFNNLMKKTPKLLRYHWHQYMLYREKDPSFYMSPYNIIEKPLRTSSFSSNIKNLGAINYAIMAVSFVIGLAYVSSSAFSALEFAQVLVIPSIIFIINVIFIMLLRARQDRNISKFYLYFHYFDRKMDKAVTTMPEYVDFEVLFTRKEIKKGISVLNEYLEKRARQEQEELEKARLNAVEHEVFDFSSMGIDGSLVLDRAMKETETYLNFRQRTLGEIQQFESEVESLKRNYENTQKDYQRKLQASKENVDRLRKQQEESTNRIEGNYIKKQQQDEIKKQEQLERDFDDSTVRFNNEVQALQTEISNKRAELEERRKFVEEAMKAEYETFSKKVYDQIDKSIEDKVNEEKQAIIQLKDGISEELQQANFTIEAQKKEIADLRKALDNAGVSNGEYEYFNEALREEAKKVKVGKKDSKSETAETQQDDDVAQQVDSAQQSEQANEEPVYDEYGGYYDDQGYYRYANGTYYDPDGNYHDEFGGVYDKDGNYFPPENNENNVVQEENIEQQPVENLSDEENQLEGTTDQEGVVEESSESNEIDESVQENEQENEEHKEVKKRGRPRKVETENVDVVEPKKRGRPRKETTEKVDETQPKRRGRPKKVQDEGANETENVTKKRGRPRKVQTEEDQKPKKGRGRPRKVEEQQEEGKVKNKVGRPKKDATSENKVGRPAKNSSTSRKVGRPKKNVTEETTPAKRGRPRKVETESSETVEPKKRGRPKKVQSESEQSPKQAKKRGRPRKTQDSLDEIKRLNEQILEENLKLQRQQAELNNALGITLSQLDNTETAQSDNPSIDNVQDSVQTTENNDDNK